MTDFIDAIKIDECILDCSNSSTNPLYGLIGLIGAKSIDCNFSYSVQML